MKKLVTYQLTDGIATIAMDDGKANALSLAVQAELNAALDQALADRALVVLTGRQGMFCGGFDLPALMGGGANAVKMLTGGFEIAEKLLSFPQPVVIACTGHAVAMGIFLVMSGDYCIGAEGGFKIGANEVAIGLTMPRAAIEICRARLAPAHFNRAMMTAEIYTPVEAVAAGFLDKVVAASDVVVEAHVTAARFAKLNMPAYKGTKLLVREQMLKALRGAIEADNASFRALFNLQ
jgi:enoyl-CoA hydratase